MEHLGELETLVLLGILRVAPDSYGVAVRDAIAEYTSRRLSRGAIYSALRRLERKGLLTSTLGEATPQRGGRAKRYWALTDEGLSSLRTALDNADRMREGLDPVLQP